MGKAAKIVHEKTKERRVAIRIWDSTLTRADELAQAKEWTRSAALRWLIEKGLEHAQKKGS